MPYQNRLLQTSNVLLQEPGKDVNGQNHLGQLLSQDFWSQTISCGKGGGISECTGDESRTKIHVPVLDQSFPTCVFGYTCATNMLELLCLLPAHTHGHLSPEPSRSAATAEEMCHRMIPRHNSSVAAQEGHSVAPILIQGKYFPQYGRLSKHCHRLASWMRASRETFCLGS